MLAMIRSDSSDINIRGETRMWMWGKCSTDLIFAFRESERVVHKLQYYYFHYVYVFILSKRKIKWKAV